MSNQTVEISLRVGSVLEWKATTPNAYDGNIDGQALAELLAGLVVACLPLLGRPALVLAQVIGIADSYAGIMGDGVAGSETDRTGRALADAAAAFERAWFDWDEGFKRAIKGRTDGQA